MPAIDLKLDFHKLAPHYYFPGWHQPSSLFTLMINLDRWNSLTSTQQAQIKSVCGDNIRYGLAEGEALQYGALKKLIAKGVRIHTWPAAVLDGLKDAWRQVAAEQAAANGDFARAWKSLNTFREDYAIWREISHP